jgi:hypothetical protein
MLSAERRWPRRVPVVVEGKRAVHRNPAECIHGIFEALHVYFHKIIPRDTYTKISGKGTMDKINHSYAFGGTQMAADTVRAPLVIFPLIDAHD